MAQLSAAIDGIAEACTALGTPITGGNVSLYNETRGEGIYPTPVIGIVGLLDDVTKAVPDSFQRRRRPILFLSAIRGRRPQRRQDFGATAYAQSLDLPLWGAPPRLDSAKKPPCIRPSQALADSRSARLRRRPLRRRQRRRACQRLLPQRSRRPRLDEARLTPDSPFAMARAPLRRDRLLRHRACRPSDLNAIRASITGFPQLWPAPSAKSPQAGSTSYVNDEPIIAASTSDLQQALSETLASQLAAEVVTA